MEKTIFDTDPGIDDAMALLLIHSMQDLDLMGITTVFGNASIDACTRNALYICERFGLPYSVHEGAGKTLVGKEEEAYPDFVHGMNGLGDIELTAVTTSKHSQSAVDYLIEQSKITEGLSVLAVGRLTNLAMALQEDPGLGSRLSRIVIMGGAIHVEGNVSPWAEANIFGDPEAAEVVFRSGTRIDLVPLDATLVNIVTRDALRDVTKKMGDAGEFLWSIKQHYLEFYKTKGRGDVFPMHDSSAALALTHPELFDWESGDLSCVVEGEERGRTVLKANNDGLHRVAINARQAASWRVVQASLQKGFGAVR